MATLKTREIVICSRLDTDGNSYWTVGTQQCVTLRTTDDRRFDTVAEAASHVAQLIQPDDLIYCCGEPDAERAITRAGLTPATKRQLHENIIRG